MLIDRLQKPTPYLHAKMPGTWSERKLSEVSDIRFSNVDKKSTPGETDVRLCNYLDVYNNNYITDDLDFMKATASYAEIARFTVEPGDVIMTKDSETPDDIGVPAVSVESIPNLVCGYHLALIRPNRDEVEPVFLAGQIAHDRIGRYFSLHANGTTRFGLTASAIANTPLWLPPLPEQRCIAEILIAADEAIRRSERVIAKLREVKKGLLQDLLTRGLDADGNLRDPDAHPEQFKDSPVGRIPREWKVHKVEELLRDLLDFRGQTPRKLGMEWGGEIPAISANNVEMGRLNLDREVHLGSEALYQRWMNRGDVERGDIIMTMEAPLGNIAQIPDDRRYILSQRVVLLKTVAGVVDNGFLKHHMMGDSFQKQLMERSTGTTAVGIQQAKLRLLLASIPPIAEQRRIAAVLDAHDARIRAEEATLDKLRQVKRGLMHDLLTGQVRV
jgi:type I restriction enzyme S subunit